MNLLQLKRHWIDGEPRHDRRGNTSRIKAAHRLPSTRDIRTGLYLLVSLAALSALISQYAPDMQSKPDENYMLQFAAYVVMGVSNALGALAEVANADAADAPLENLRGWMFTLYWIGGAILVMELGLFQLLTWLGNREHVTIIVDHDEVFVRHGVFRAKSVPLESVEVVLILPNPRAGHDVMLQHEGGLTRLASVYGDLSRPILIKRCVERALAEGSQHDERRVAALADQTSILSQACN